MNRKMKTYKSTVKVKLRPTTSKDRYLYGWGNGAEKEYIVTYRKPEDLFLSVANMYQLFYRNVTDKRDWVLRENETHYTELPIDEERLSQVEVIAINEVETGTERVLFSIGGDTN